MAPPNVLTARVAPGLDTHAHKSLLRFITCGSVDDGKSTLIGRMLWESHALLDDQIAALQDESKTAGTCGGQIDYALLLDGLSAEREQGITIDVAYRFFATSRRKFIVADTPGHEQYTRNMVTGASTADLAIVLVDARKGLLTQTRRHSYLVSLLGIREVVLAVTKMDLVEYSQLVFTRIERQYRELARSLGFANVVAIPVSGIHGDNIVAQSAQTPWYHGPTLMAHLETVDVDERRLQQVPFRMPVQWVNRPNLQFRGYAGTVAAGAVRPGDRVCVQPSGRESTVERIVAAGGDLDQAVADQAITLTLADEIDLSRGDIICAAGAPAQVADQFEATIVWMSEQPMLRGRSYLMKLGHKTVTATIAPLKHKTDVSTFEHLAATKLELNEIGVCGIQLDRPIAFDPYADNRDTGGFILIDRFTNSTIGAGMLRFALRRATNVRWQDLEVKKRDLASAKMQKPCVIWMTGLSGAGKSTIANLLQKKLHASGRHTYLLDGDNVRHGLNRDLGFTDADRVENIRRVSEVARLMVDAGLMVIVAFISPFRNERRAARLLVEPGEFIEVFVDAPLDVAEARDPKGLYRKARRGELQNFTGIDSPYEAPEDPEIRIDTTIEAADAAVERIVAYVESAGLAEPA